MDSQFAALVVHDIKNALAILEGELETLSRETGQARASQAWRDCARLREKLVGFLTLYKAAGGGLQARTEAVSPADFLNSLCTGSMHVRTGVRLELDLAQAPALAFFDEYLAGLALEAALQNAMRYARSCVTLSCRPGTPRGVVFGVRDDGPGPGPSVAAQGSSTGLGIELCRAVAAAHRHGQLAGSCLLADAPGGGALFELQLP